MRKPPAVAVVDFETLPIQARPHYPPVPVGVSIQPIGEKKAKYYAWAHPTENNCDKAEAVRALRGVWGGPLLFHNAKFDLDVGQTHMDMGAVDWSSVHDTMFLLFLHDPHSPDLQLKPAAERILALAPEERDKVKEWVLANAKWIMSQPTWPSELKITPSKWGAGIGYAPGGLVGPYANGDTLRTKGLFNHLWPRIAERGMLPAYDRERELMPILLENERVGMRVDTNRLGQDVIVYEQALVAADRWLCNRLKVKDLNLDADADLAAALSKAGVIADESWSLTKTGRRSVSKKTLLPEMFTDAKVFKVLGYRNRLATCLRMFMQPWLEQATARRDHHISTNWNQVRQAKGSSTGGTRTGRPSTENPNFLNISKTWGDKDDGYEHPTFMSALPELPLVRRYVLPDRNGVFLHRDYNGQELRILGHYEDGALLAAYRENPRMDVHEFVRQLIDEITGLQYHRTQVKITNFRRIYGGGAPATASALNVSIEAAKELLAAHGRALPGVKDLNKSIKAISDRGEPIVTWGGREYFVELPRWDERFKRNMTYEYKLLNYLVQGSAADATKQAIINYHNHPDRHGRFLVTVYDEINVSSAKWDAVAEMRVLKDCMECLDFDVPMLSDGKLGPNWAELKKYED